MLFKMTEPEVKPISPPRSELTLLCRDARGSPLRLGLGDEIWQGHILVTGGTGSGKTTVIRQLLALPGCLPGRQLPRAGCEGGLRSLPPAGR